MSEINDPGTANLFIPTLILSSQSYAIGTDSQKKQLRDLYRSSDELFKGLLFYAQLFNNLNQWIAFDRFRWIPLTYEEINRFALLGNTLDTIIQNKIEWYTFGYQIKLWL